ncbi:hypothetical protein KKG36_00980 [Patescibacteria group bacterium]|nr:hypothetical protein [Patescibacteria group bacterium]
MWLFKKKQPIGADPREKWGILFRFAGEAKNQINALLTFLGEERDKARQRDANFTKLLAAVIKMVDNCDMVLLSTPIIQNIRENLAATLSQQGIKEMDVRPGQKVSDFAPSFLSITLVEGNDGEILEIIEPGYVTTEGELVRTCSVFAGMKSPLPEQINK